MAIQGYLREQGLTVSRLCDDESAVANYLSGKSPTRCTVVLLLATGGTLKSYGLIKEVLDKSQATPLVVLSDQITRGQIYAALRAGAKAFVNLNSDPKELPVAIRMAAANKIYLSPDAAEMLLTDISGAIETPRTSGKISSALSRREMEIVQFLCNGLSSKEIAKSLHLSTKTVENHRYNIYRKCEVESIAGLIRHAVQHGLVSF